MFFLKLDYARRSKLINHPEMALPGVETAKIQDGKIISYCFNQKYVVAQNAILPFQRHLTSTGRDMNSEWCYMERVDAPQM